MAVSPTVATVSARAGPASRQATAMERANRCMHSPSWPRRGASTGPRRRIRCNSWGRMVAARRDMRLRRRFLGLVAALLAVAPLAGCGTSIHELNLRPEKHYQQKLEVVGRVMRLQSLGG